MADLIVAGAGMAGLAAAAQARTQGAEVEVYEKLDRAGGAMRLSSGVIWRHRTLEEFGEDCPQGDPGLQAAIIDRLDADLEWLRELGAPVSQEGTGNARTSGCRFDPGGLTEALLGQAGRVRFSEPLRQLPEEVPVILATGGFAADRGLLERYVTPQAEHLLLRAAPGATGDGLRLAATRDEAALSDGLEQAYGRNMPAPPARLEAADFVSKAQLYAHAARISNARDEVYEARSWSQIDVFQWTALQPRARAWFRVGKERFAERVGGRTIGEMVEAAAAAGAPVRHQRGAAVVETVAGITSTLGGLAVDSRARVADGLFAAGADVGGIATGGYCSGLAAALVLGRIAADSALGGS